ncbi:DUF4124 domain-containing protein [Marinobacter halodurans]|uniref:DUF4124 domain-containing protein n=1 Tax=Marinobacter halodurans TaxID=2528979 RepID=A0ABY1ZNN9_9GAMM|nr:DUF4124 domain-containing protein [Marinobacter halodurans]TBW55499.1 DUF4124 domain-containing protein [Marinobacter halodurans]
MRESALFLLCCLLAPATFADVYKCADANGVRYSDTPCGANAETLNLPDSRIGGRFDSNLPARPEPSEPADEPASAPSEPESPCRYIPSTDLRRYILREQVVRGMTKQNVRDAFGTTPEVYPVPQETWVYKTDYYGMLYELTYVYFRDGCVDRVVYRKP